MFTNSCIILKNTKHLRDKLEEFGYKIPLCYSYYEGRKRGLLCRPNLAIGVPEDCDDFNLDEYLKNNPYIINCGTNEDLFLALAALRNDSDKYQFFTDGIHWEIYPLEGFINNDMIRKWELRYNELGVKYKLHKATVQELIQHFKDK